ncbi:MAG: FHA domain-containing protein, partial [Myxococcota bacterium]
MPTALKLTVHHGEDVIAQETFERDIVKIGRLASAHLKLDDPKVSRIHAVIEATNDGVGYAIIDMGSTEGTVLNGRKISKERLSDGDELVLGDLRVLVNMALDAASFDGSGIPGPPLPSGKPAPPGSGTPPPQMVDAPDAGMPPVPPPTADVGRVDESKSTNASSDGPDAASSAGAASASPADSSAPNPSTKPSSAEDGVPDDASTPSAQVGQPSMQGEAKGMANPVPASAQSFPAGLPPAPPPPVAGYPVMPMFDPWGSVPNNLASDAVPPRERMLEVRAVWGTNVLDTFTVSNQPKVTIGDDRRVVGWGPFQRIETCDIQVPAEGLPSKTYVLAEYSGKNGTTYTLHLPPGFDGHIQRADGTMIPLAHLYQGGEGAQAGHIAGSIDYTLRAAETVYLVYGNVIFQIRYIRRTPVLGPALWADINYSWLNVLLLAAFVHVMLIVAFHSIPRTQAELTEDLFRNPNRFAQFRFTPEQRRKTENTILAKLKARSEKARGRGQEGKAGRKDKRDLKKGRAANKAPKKEDQARSALDRLLGNTPGKGVRASMVFGSSDLGGDLRAALGGVSGRDVGASAGLSGAGTRGLGSGGGGGK